MARFNSVSAAHNSNVLRCATGLSKEGAAQALARAPIASSVDRCALKGRPDAELELGSGRVVPPGSGGRPRDKNIKIPVRPEKEPRTPKPGEGPKPPREGGDAKGKSAGLAGGTEGLGGRFPR